jgi:hypothetical protein
MTPRLFAAYAALVLLPFAQVHAQDAGRRPIPLKASVSRVQPMTGIVLWTTSEHHRTDAVQLEYSYMKYSDIVKKRDEYDWKPVDQLLDAVAGRGHQAVLRFYFVYPGKPTTVPAYIKALPDYKETRGKSENKDTSFCDWSHPEMKRFLIEFYSKFAKRYDTDRRLAFLETGFGLWAEYHIYSGPMQLGKTFPSKALQSEFLRHLGKEFVHTPWMISVDAADGERAPFEGQRDLLKLRFGVFDDSFLCKQHKRENEPNWNFFGRERWKQSPAGGEFSFYTKQDQTKALANEGPNGVPFEKAAADFHLTFIIGDDQPRFQPIERIRSAGQACGYRFRILAFEANAKQSRITVTNTGVAPLYHDAFLTVNGVRGGQSLKGLLPGEKRVEEIAAGGAVPVLTISSDRLVPGQRIEFDADLK